MTKRPLVLKSSDLDFEDLPLYYMFYVFYYQTMDFKWILLKCTLLNVEKKHMYVVIMKLQIPSIIYYQDFDADDATTTDAMAVCSICKYLPN